MLIQLMNHYYLLHQVSYLVALIRHLLECHIIKSLRISHVSTISKLPGVGRAAFDGDKAAAAVGDAAGRGAAGAICGWYAAGGFITDLHDGHCTSEYTGE